MRAHSYRDRALVIRSYDFGEADRIIVFLTRTQGLVRAVAKGVRRAKSRFGSRLQPFVELDVHFYPGRNLETVTAADTLDFFASPLIDDFTRFSAASSVLEAAERLSLSSYGEHEQLYDLTLEKLKEFPGKVDTLLILDSYLLQAMDLAGWAPSLFACAQCGVAGPHHAFHPAPGGAVCVQCRPQGSTEVDPEVLHLLWFLQQGFIAQAEAIADKYRITTGHRLVRAHLQWHLEKGLASLNILEQGF
ncbi:DNA repair protein [Corynebacterium kutscheri]|uniref:DNA repair protein RecO n=1 Tax=Corynebacterium kutscheri TaxID=35755 RepID=A0A0F6QZ59_9CORY|nr:DNA repair protein RecO [Corynebacterium kutscheri]AKE40952.1 DNA replication and repair protein RecO [Corynebacterium kutscheri]VEH06793.1 DNA repair protein [Corynebacterium kutscheri]VEH09251.1 DNA repair protein [Corynebacterium kutscheri]VEH79338.1 DNA repair protein [Corynebacterium kutscheri]